MIYFRIGCVALLLTACLHLVGHFNGLTPTNDTEKQLLDLMINYKMYIGSDEITMMGMQKGFSLLFTVLLIWPGMLGLYLAKNSTTQTLRIVNFMYVGAMVIETGVSQIYFFIVPTACVAISTLFFVIAAFTIRPKSAN